METNGMNLYRDERGRIYYSPYDETGEYTYLEAYDMADREYETEW